MYHRLAKRPDYLQKLHAVVRSLPDKDDVYSTDLKHFRSRMALRKNGRCRVGILSDDLI